MLQEDYKRAIQLAINEQRKKIRLNQRLHNMEKEAVVLKKRAKSLLNLCRTGSDGHQMDDADTGDADHLSPADEKPGQNLHKKTSPGSGTFYFSDVCSYRWGFHFQFTRVWLFFLSLVMDCLDQDWVWIKGSDSVGFAVLVSLIHLRLLVLEYRVPCDVCNKMVKKSWLKRHKLVLHSHDRPHLCEECGRTFVMQGINQSDLNKILLCSYSDVYYIITSPMIPYPFFLIVLNDMYFGSWMQLNYGRTSCVSTVKSARVIYATCVENPSVSPSTSAAIWRW